MDTLTLFSDDGITYLWTGPDGFNSTEANPIAEEVSIPMGGEYTVIVTNDFGCTTEESTIVEIIALPDVSFESLDAVLLQSNSI